MRRIRGIGALGVAAVLVLTGCSTTVAGTPVAGQPGAVGPVPAGLDRFYAQQLNWGGCAEYVTDVATKSLYESDDVQCARMRVPLDYAKPDGREITIGLLRKKAVITSERIGSLVLNPGGPGQSGMLAAAAIAKESWDGTPLGEKFDLVGFDPRGIGASEPNVKCLSDAEKDAERLEPPTPGTGPEAVAAVEAENKEFAEKCAANSGADVLANVGTREVVKDMDVLRSVLRDRKLNYLGISYGTRIGTAYAEAFPRNVRAMVLDGAVDPNQDRAGHAIGQANGFKKAFDAFVQSCVQDPGCPLGTDAARAEAKLDAMLEPLKAKPVDARGRKLSYSDAVTAVFQCLYSEELWGPLETGLEELRNGRGDLLLSLADYYLGRGSSGKYSNMHDAFAAIHCVDDPPIKDRAVLEEQLRRIRAAVPKSALDEDEDLVAALDECAFWPVPHTSQPHEPKVDGLPKVLVVSSTGDPATPHESGVKLAKALGASLLTVEANSHGAFLGENKCVNDAGTAYLVELKNPADGAKCQ